MNNKCLKDSDEFEVDNRMVMMCNERFIRMLTRTMISLENEHDITILKRNIVHDSIYPLIQISAESICFMLPVSLKHEKHMKELEEDYKMFLKGFTIPAMTKQINSQYRLNLIIQQIMGDSNSFNNNKISNLIRTVVFLITQYKIVNILLYYNDQVEPNKSSVLITELSCILMSFATYMSKNVNVHIINNISGNEDSIINTLINLSISDNLQLYNLNNMGLNLNKSASYALYEKHILNKNNNEYTLDDFYEDFILENLYENKLSVIYPIINQSKIIHLAIVAKIALNMSGNLVIDSNDDIIYNFIVKSLNHCIGYGGKEPDNSEEKKTNLLINFIYEIINDAELMTLRLHIKQI